MGSRGLHVNWDQANVSLRRSPQEQSKKLVRNKRAESCGTKAQQASGRPKFLSLEVSYSQFFTFRVPQITFHPQSRKTQRKKDSSSELESQLHSSDSSSVSTFLLVLPRTSVWKTKGPGGKVVFKGVTFHLGTLQPLDPLVWRKQLGLCQEGSLP